MLINADSSNLQETYGRSLGWLPWSWIHMEDRLLLRKQFHWEKYSFTWLRALKGAAVLEKHYCKHRAWLDGGV